MRIAQNQQKSPAIKKWWSSQSTIEQDQINEVTRHKQTKRKIIEAAWNFRQQNQTKRPTWWSNKLGNGNWIKVTKYEDWKHHKSLQEK